MPQTDLYLINVGQEQQLPTAGELDSNIPLTPAPAATNRVVQGTVFDTDSNPVAGAVVKVVSSTYTPVAHTTTNPVGHYIFNQLEPGNYYITAIAPGFINPPLVSFSLGQAGTLNIDITLPPFPVGAYNTSIYGMVKDQSTGQPIQGATVTINTITQQGEELFGTTLTGVTGQYFSLNLPSGDYTVQASAANYQLSPKTTTTIVDNQFNDVDFSLVIDPLAALGTVSGIITHSSTGLPLPYAFVALYEVIDPQQEQIIALGRAQSDGFYLFGSVPPNKTYVVKAKVVNIPPIPPA